MLSQNRRSFRGSRQELCTLAQDIPRRRPVPRQSTSCNLYWLWRTRAFAHFRDVVSYYGVALYECGHATGAKHRLDRDLTGRFGSEAYAAEELCVELASAMALADLGLGNHPRPDHAAYLTSWLKVMRDDPRAIFTAASKAQAITDWMHAQQPPPWD